MSCPNIRKHMSALRHCWPSILDLTSGVCSSLIRRMISVSHAFNARSLSGAGFLVFIAQPPLDPAPRSDCVPKPIGAGNRSAASQFETSSAWDARVYLFSCADHCPAMTIAWHSVSYVPFIARHALTHIKRVILGN